MKLTNTDVSPSGFAKAFLWWLAALGATFGILFASCSAKGATIPFSLPRWLDAIQSVESMGDDVPGDRGRAWGRYQMHAAAVADVNQKTGWRHSVRDLVDPGLARSYATVYAGILADLLAASGCKITPANLWAAWNTGHRRFRSRGFLVSRCPHATRIAARFISEYTYGN